MFFTLKKVHMFSLSKLLCIVSRLVGGQQRVFGIAWRTRSTTTTLLKRYLTSTLSHKSNQCKPETVTATLEVLFSLSVSFSFHSHYWFHCFQFVLILSTFFIQTFLRKKKNENIIKTYSFFTFLFLPVCACHAYDARVFRFLSGNVTTSDDKATVADLEKNIIKRKAQLYDIEQSLPQKNGLYLKVTETVKLSLSPISFSFTHGDKTESHYLHFTFLFRF